MSTQTSCQSIGEAAAFEANRQRIALQTAFAPHREALRQAQRQFESVPRRKRTPAMCKAFGAAAATYQRELSAYEAACEAIGAECFL